MYVRRVLRLATFYPLKLHFSNKQSTNQSVFDFTTSDKVNRCSGRTNCLYFIWYHIKIIICRNFDVQNRNGEISLKIWYDSAKIGMVGISVIIWLSLLLTHRIMEYHEIVVLTILLGNKGSSKSADLPEP